MRPPTIIARLLWLALVVSAGGLAVVAPSDAAESPRTSTYIVVLKGVPPSTPDAAEQIRAVASALVAEHGGAVERIYGSALHGFTARLTATQAKAMGSDRRVRYVEADSEMRIQPRK